MTEIAAMSHPLIEPNWLLDHLSDADIVIFDCRYNLRNPSQARVDYNSGHIPGALYLDMESDLAGPVTHHGGRHPIPSATAFAETMTRYGVTESTYCVGYDVDGVGAARLWWLLRYFGHRKALVLNGGYHSWLKNDYPISHDAPQPKPGIFQAHPGHMPTIHFASINSRHHYVMDSRAEERYRGDIEPIDKVAGHIPGAAHYDYQKVFDAPGHYRSKEDLINHFAKIPAQRPPVLYCGSGVSACVNVFALQLIGVTAILYPGSWSDWISYPENAIMAGSEIDLPET